MKILDFSRSFPLYISVKNKCDDVWHMDVYCWYTNFNFEQVITILIMKKLILDWNNIS